MRFSLRFASSFVVLALLSAACGGSEPPPAPPPTPAPTATPTPAVSVPAPVEDAGAPVAVAPAPTVTPSFVAKRQGTIRDLAVDGRWTYWLTQDGDVKRAPSSGGPALKVEGFGATASGLVVFGGKMYTSAADPKSKGFSLLRADPDLANKPDVLATQAGTTAFLSADRAHVAWGTATGKKLSLVVVGKDVKITKLPAVDATAPSPLALAPSTVCYFDNGQLHHPPLTGKGDPKTWLGVTLSDADIRAIGVVGNRFFVAVIGPATDAEHETVFSAPVDGGVVDLVAKDQANVTSFVADEGAIYWTARGTKAAGFADGKIMKADGHTNATVTLVENQHAPTKIAVDDEAVTWTNDNAEDNAGDTDVMRLSK